MKAEKKLIKIDEGVFSAVHRFRTEKSEIPILLIHGSMENSRIFFSKSGKGFAPFLAKNGFDVFAIDMVGKGKSKPLAFSGIKHSQQDFIHRDMARYINHIRSFYPEKQICIGAHSWGGVLALAWYAFYGNRKNTGPMVFFGAKRRIAVFHLKRILWVDIIWSGLGYLTTAINGYFPSGKMKIGIADEPGEFFKETNTWVYRKKWIDHKTGENISEKLLSKSKPPILYFAGLKDNVLGHPLDIERLINETGEENSEFVLLSKNGGNCKDYGHNDILTDKVAQEDHFIKAVDWLKQES